MGRFPEAEGGVVGQRGKRLMIAGPGVANMSKPCMRRRSAGSVAACPAAGNKPHDALALDARVAAAANLVRVDSSGPSRKRGNFKRKVPRVSRAPARDAAGDALRRRTDSP